MAFLGEMEFIMNVLDAIMYRTSYRGAYKDVAVPREDLERIVRAGFAAPSGCNTQSTSLIAVDDAELLEKLREFIQPKFAKTAPAIVFVLTQKIYPYKDKCYNIQDYSAAIQNMLLAVVELGYETCWYEGLITGVDPNGERADIIGRHLADILGVPEDYDLVCYLPVGVAEQDITRRSKKPFEERVWFNGFKTP